MRILKKNVDAKGNLQESQGFSFHDIFNSIDFHVMYGKNVLNSSIRTMMIPMKMKPNPIVKECPVEVALNVIDGKWKLRILYFLQNETLRYNGLQEKIPGITQKVLTSQLRQLEKDGIVIRKMYAEIPPRVEYSLTPIGKKLLNVYQALNTWALEYIDREYIRDRIE